MKNRGHLSSFYVPLLSCPILSKKCIFFFFADLYWPQLKTKFLKGISICASQWSHSALSENGIAYCADLLFRRF